MATLIDQEFFARLRALNDKFAASVPATLAKLRENRAAFDAQAPDKAILATLQETLHTIAGSAATFGFRSFGQHARTLEQRLRVLQAGQATTAQEWAGWMAALDAYIVWAEIDPKAEDGLDAQGMDAQ